MKKLFIIFFLLVVSFVYAEKYESPMSIYQDNYFVFGNSEDQIKFQVSAKYSLLYPCNSGLYAGYTQRSWWLLYDKSAPFTETNYSPELFYRLESYNNLFDDANLGFLDYLQISPISHLSNGKDGLDSRSINTYYAQIQLSVGDKYNVGTNVKVFNYYNKSSKNRDIENFKSYYEADIFFKIRSKDVYLLDKEELHFKFGGYDKSDFTNKEYTGWYCIEGQFRLITSIIQPRIFIQYYKGYGEFLINYNKKEEAIRLGLTF